MSVLQQGLQTLLVKCRQFLEAGLRKIQQLDLGRHQTDDFQLQGRFLLIAAFDIATCISLLLGSLHLSKILVLKGVEDRNPIRVAVAQPLNGKAE